MALSEAYRKAMGSWNYGYPLYNPQSTKDLHTGICGYLDGNDVWQTIVDLEFDDVEKMGFTEFVDSFYPKTPQNVNWKAKFSQGLKKIDIDLSGGVSAASLGLPATVTAATKWECRGDAGAILMCDNPVTIEDIGASDIFLKWAKTNSKKLRKDYPSVKKFYVVTRTYSSSDIHLIAWNDSDFIVTLGVSGKVEGAGEASGTGTWSRSNTTQGWESFPAGDTDEKYVVFFSGVMIKVIAIGPIKTSLVTSVSSGSSRFRGDGDKFSVVDEEEGMEYEVELESFGKTPEDLAKEGKL
ncbi:hypothetical protein BDZ45DRAFT_722268 [Acephala macrosclerotiorum]|nr:hypothetical protein BDZ45DRAFT_722268 [Acephala macrosclerotiorum]